MPSLKLVRVIQTKDFNIIGKVNKISLISNPFPIICCSTDLYIYIFDINGELIKYFCIGKGLEVEFSIDKNCGRVKDYIIFNNNGKLTRMNFI